MSDERFKKRGSYSPSFSILPAQFSLVMSRGWIILLLPVLFYSCNGGTVDHLFKKSSPYEKYLSSLESTSLDDYALVQDWKKAGEETLTDSLQIALPYQEVGYFDPRQPEAMLLRYPVEEGNQIHVRVEPVSQPGARFFMEIFQVDPMDQSLERIHFADSSGNLSYQVRDAGIHAVRVQPELFRGGMFSLSIASEGLLAFPLLDQSTKNIASFWGNPRDGNTRKHEGVDVFASRGTPVLAASSGRIRRVGENRLGGKVVWLSNSELGHSQYYAHLDSQLVRAGQQVQAGDTLGLVGNTGNARTTAPHLHFGIYRAGRGAVNPFPFLQKLTVADETSVLDSTQLYKVARVKVDLANLRSSPGTSSSRISSYKRNTLISIKAKTGRWYRVSLPDKTNGYIFETLVENAITPIAELELVVFDELWETWNSPISISGHLLEGKAKALGEFNDFCFLKTATGIKGWYKVKL